VTAEEAVVAHLAADSGVTALVAQRIYQLKFPQKPTLPAVRVFLVDESQPSHLRGGGTTRTARIQIDTLTAEGSGTDAYGQAAEVAAAIDDAMLNKPALAFDGGALEVKITRRLDRRALPPIAEELREVMIQQDYAVTARQRT
jgi:hypothetical protein